MDNKDTDYVNSRRTSRKINPDYIVFEDPESASNESSEFAAESDEDDDFFMKVRSNKRALTGKEKEQRSRDKELCKFVSKSGESDDSDSSYFSNVKNNHPSLIASQRPKRHKSKDKIVDDLPAEYFLENSDLEENDAENVLDAAPLPQIEKIIGFSLNGEERLYYTKYTRSTYADLVFLSKEDVSKHPSGASNLTSFLKSESDYGLKESEIVPGVFVLKDEENLMETREIEKVIAYNEENGLYLVKWKKFNYDDCSWIKNVPNDNAIDEFKKRNNISRVNRPTTIQPYRPFGTEENMIPLPKYKNSNELRDYQIKALNWLRFAYSADRNAILADEMGLGKTVMCIAMIQDIIANYGISGPFLIVAPLGTLPNWHREFSNWSDIETIVFHGSQPARDLIVKHELFFKPPFENTPKFQVLLTNIETVQKSIELIQSIKWHFVIIDEAHKLKNINSKIYKMMFSLQMEHVLLMTGTPIQNNIDEIYALLHFIAPIKFPSLEDFRKQHGSIENAEDVTKLQEAIRPYMLRRKKVDVETSIAAKEETIVEVELTKSQKYYYRMLLDFKSEEMKNHTSNLLSQDIQNLAMQLRKVCNHPFLLPSVEDEIVKPGENPVEVMINASGKLVFVDKLLAKLKEKKNKILIFSQMVKILNILEDFLNYREYSYVRLDGSIVGEERQKSIDKFNDPKSGVFVFLLCTRAGGVGLNLTAANTVIIYDSDWNPQNDLQAQARCHRIGQTQEVQVYRLITRGTYENEMFLRASMKLGLDQAILDSNSNTGPVLSPKEIEHLIKKGAYSVFQEEDEETEKFVAEDVDQILQRRSRPFSKSAVDKESIFSKASFIYDRDGEQIDINDKHFWDKIIPQEKRITRAKEEILGPRRSRSMVYTDSEIEKEPGDTFSWNAKTRDLLFDGLLMFGWGRWNEIKSKTKIKCDIGKIIDGCTAILSIICKNLDDPSILLMELLQSEDLDITKSQKRLLSLAAFSNPNWIKSVSSNSDEHAERLRFLKAIADWFNDGCQTVKFGQDSVPRNWNSKCDHKLLRATHIHGWGNWKAVFKDNNIWGSIKFDTTQVNKISKRLEQLSDSLINMFTSDDENENVVMIPDMKLADMKALLGIVSELGIPDNDEAWEIYSHYFDEDDNYQDIVRSIVNCSRFVAFIDSKTPASSIKRALSLIVQSGESLYPSLTQPLAIHIRDNNDWFKRLRTFSTTILPHCSVDSLTEPLSFVPSFWKKGEHDIELIKHVCKFGFASMDTLLTKNKSFIEYISEDDIDLIEQLRVYHTKHGSHKRFKGELVFFFDEDSIIARITEFVETTGGWKCPRYIDIPEKNSFSIQLPFVYGNSVIESLGDGEFGCINGYLYRIGLTLTARYRNIAYKCNVKSIGMFEIRKTDKIVFTAETPEELWKQVDPDFDEDSLSLFGLTNHQVQYIFNDQCKVKPLDYIEPIFDMFKTPSISSR